MCIRDRAEAGDGQHALDQALLLFEIVLLNLVEYAQRPVLRGADGKLYDGQQDACLLYTSRCV